MACTATLHQKREAITGGYKITSTITVATGISKYLFLFKQSDNVYQHVCTVDDLVRYPVTPDPAIAFYRHDDVILTYTTEDLDVAIGEAALQKSRLLALLPEWTVYSATFVGEEDTVYTG